MKIAPDNIFPGARIKSGDTVLTVIKVNQKTFYASEMGYSDFLERFNSRPKGITFTAFCKAYDIKSYTYSEKFEIEDGEVRRRVVANENAKENYKLESWERADIISMVKYFETKGRSLRLFQFESRGKTIRFLEQKEKCFMLNINDDYVLLSLDTDECIKISTVYDYREKYSQVPWEKLSVFAEEQAAEKVSA